MKPEAKHVEQGKENNNWGVRFEVQQNASYLVGMVYEDILEAERFDDVGSLVAGDHVEHYSIGRFNDSVSKYLDIGALGFLPR